MSVTAERLRHLGLDLPVPTRPEFAYRSAVVHNSLVYCSGHIAMLDGQVRWPGKLGAEVSVEEGQQAARLCALNCLGAVAQLIGDLDRVVTLLKVNGYVASAPGFGEQSAVLNGASVLFEGVLGQAGQHARTAIGVAELPFGASVEVELVAALG